MLRAAQLWTIRDYVGQRCHNIAKTIEGQALFEEYRGAKRRSGSLNRQMWWQQEMELEEDNNGHFYDAAGNEVRAERVQRRGILPTPLLDPRERYIDRPDADEAPETFNRGVDLDE